MGRVPAAGLPEKIKVQKESISGREEILSVFNKYDARSNDGYVQYPPSLIWLR
jgi:hypothetical protein